MSAQSFVTIQQKDEGFQQIGQTRQTSIAMEVDEAMVDKMAQLIQQSSAYDDILVVERF